MVEGPFAQTENRLAIFAYIDSRIDVLVTVATTQGGQSRPCRVFVFLVLLGTGTCCSPRPTATSLPAKLDVAPEVKTSLARPSWGARFSSPTELTRCVDIVSQSRLCFGALGERWLDGPDAALASPYLAPETLVAAWLTDSKTWLFVGRHGTRFSADTALGPFTSMQRASRKYIQYTADTAQWCGLTDEGELWRGTLNDITGVRVALPQRLFDFALSPSGTGVALGIPERIWITSNQGSNWKELEVGPFGARSVSVDEQGGLSLLALLPPSDIADDDVKLRATTATSDLSVKLRHAPAIFPEAQASIEGRSALVGPEVVELKKIDESWQIARGALDKPLNLTKPRGIEACVELRLSVSSEASLVICRKSSAQKNVEALSLYVSDAKAQIFTPMPGAISGRFSDVKIAAIAPDRFIATGLCAPAAGRRTVEPTSSDRAIVNAKDYSECHPRGPVAIELTQATLNHAKGFTYRAAAAPGAQVTAPKIAASADGSHVAFVARSTVHEPWQLYYSSDAGKTFVSRSIDALPVTGASGPTSGPATRLTPKIETREIQSLHFADDRSLSLVLRDSDAPIVFNFDDRGDLIAAAMAPPGVSRVDAVGSRILAVSLTQRDVYESLDRGASFELVGHLPAAACLTWLGCAVSCTTHGCLIGERFTRVSWGGRGAYPLDIAGNPEAQRSAFEPTTDRVHFRTPILCQAKGSPAVSMLTHAPLPEQTSLAETLWYSPWQDWHKGSAGSYRALRGRNRVEELTALQPTAHAERAAIAVSFSDAGLVFLRSTNLPKVGETLGELELAWMPSQRRDWSHARFRDAVPTKGDDSFFNGVDRARRLLPSLLSVSGDGVVVQAHSDDDHALGTHFVTAHADRTLQRIPWPIERIRNQQLLAVGDDWLAVGVDETGSVLLRARNLAAPDANKGKWEFAAQTLVNPFASRLAIQDQVQAYFGGNRPYLILGAAARGRELQSIDAHELTTKQFPLGPAVRLPLPAALNEPPPACSARDRRELMRVVVPLLPAASRAVGYRDSKGQTHWLVANHAVMFASQTRACIDTLWAETLPGMTPIHAIVALEDSGHSWVFLTKREKGDAKIEAQPAECQFDTTTNPPPEFETRTQARFNLEQLPLSD